MCDTWSIQGGLTPLQFRQRKYCTKVEVHFAFISLFLISSRSSEILKGIVAPGNHLIHIFINYADESLNSRNIDSQGKHCKRFLEQDHIYPWKILQCKKTTMFIFYTKQLCKLVLQNCVSLSTRYPVPHEFGRTIRNVSRRTAAIEAKMCRCCIPIESRICLRSKTLTLIRHEKLSLHNLYAAKFWEIDHWLTDLVSFHRDRPSSLFAQYCTVSQQLLDSKLLLNK